MKTGKTLADRYVLQERLGAGGMGAVWLANDSVLKRPVALKVLSFLDDEQRVKLFAREARIAASLGFHPSVLPVLDFGVFREGALSCPFYVSEFVPGHTLRHWIDEVAPDLEEDTAEYLGIYVLREVAAGLSYAHAKGVIHRDIKPDNILLSSETGWVKLADFGLARDIDASTGDYTAAGWGTPTYMAPEQFVDGSSSKYTDIYQLGATAYHTLFFETPFDGAGPAAQAMARDKFEPPVFDLEGDFEDETIHVLNKLMSHSPRQRPSIAKAQIVFERELSYSYGLDFDFRHYSRDAGAVAAKIMGIRRPTRRGVAKIGYPSAELSLRAALRLSLAGFTEFELQVDI